MRDADAILHVKTGELNVDALIADVIRKLNFRKMNLLYLLILCGTDIQILHELLDHKNLVLCKK